MEKTNSLLDEKDIVKEMIWEPEENLHNVGEKLQEYLQSLPKNKITSQWSLNQKER